MGIVSNDRVSRVYFRILAAFFAMGAVLHVGDLIGLRLQYRLGMGPNLAFSEMPLQFQAATVFLAIFDTLAAIGLWRLAWWGVLSFLTLAGTELIAYARFAHYFGEDMLHLAVFHGIAIRLSTILLVQNVLRKRKDLEGIPGRTT